MPILCRAALVLLGAVAPAAAHAQRPLSPVFVGGVETYRASHIDGEITCRGDTVVLVVIHTSLHLHGDCARVRLEGEHNDIFVQVPPDAVIEVTGAHNDVTWSASRRGGRPVLLDRGSRNSFHHAER